DASLGCMTPELYEEPYVLFFVNLHKNMLKALEREGLHAIPDTGHPFDYHCHKAVSSVKNPMFPSGTVIRAFRTGYEYRGKVLRFSEVEVAE
ncbi:MAG: nucleotide exchange factor GrpE, partial [Clostridia bacterium]|nr:nucleotide exchange factor GrpE [Clostridia bacterium]